MLAPVHHHAHVRASGGLSEQLGTHLTAGGSVNDSERLEAAVEISESLTPNWPFKQPFQGQKFAANFVNRNTRQRSVPDVAPYAQTSHQANRDQMPSFSE